MLHTIKRATMGAKAAKQEPNDVEYEEYQHLAKVLQSIMHGLETGVADVEASKARWLSVVKDCDDFFIRLHGNYPREDSVKSKIHRASSAVQGKIEERKLMLIHPESHGESMLSNVRLYIAQIRGIEETYPKLETAYKDYALYHQKVDKLLTAEVDDGDKQTRNVEKYEASKATYEALLHSTVVRQKSAYERAPDMYRAVFAAYCKYSSNMCTMLNEELSEAHMFSNSGEDDLIGATKHMHISDSPGRRPSMASSTSTTSTSSATSPAMPATNYGV